MEIEYRGDPRLFSRWFRVYTDLLFRNLMGQGMGTTADIKKLIDRMGRAKGLVDRAAADGDKHEATMDRFEARLNNMDDHFGKISEYEKQLAAMEQLGNGGPPLEGTFPSSGSEPATVTNSSHPDLGKFHFGTNDTFKS